MNDLRYALRSLRNSPGFTATAVLTLALGIGVNTATLSLANWLFIRPIPGVRDQDRLAVVMVAHWSTGPGFGYSPRSVTYEHLASILPSVPALKGLAGHQEGLDVSLALSGAAPRRVQIAYTMADYFSVLGLEPQLGRVFTADEDAAPGGVPVALVSDRLWKSAFSADSRVLGQEVHLNGEVFTVIGVLPAGFHGTEAFGEVDLWVPRSTYGLINHFPVDYWPRIREFYEFVARLADGATFEQAEAQLAAAIRRLAEATSGETAMALDAEPRLFAGIGVPPNSRSSVRSALRLFLATGGLVLAIACANIANLLLFRGVRQERECAVRRALGATPRRMARLYLVESVLLAVLGGGVGIVLAVWLTDLFDGARFAAVTIQGLTLDWRVFAITLGVCVATGLVFGSAPAANASRANLATALKQAARTQTPGVHRVRAAFGVIQLSLSLTLLIGAFLFIGTLQNYRGVDLGFEPRGLSIYHVDLESHGYTPERSLAYYDALLQRIRDLPGVETVSVSNLAPFLRVIHGIRILDPGTDSAVSVPMNGVSPEYFRGLGVATIRGRTFTEAEYQEGTGGSEGPAVVNQRLARQLFGARDPIGRAITLARTARDPERALRVVGVVRDSRWSSLVDDPEPFLYVPFPQNSRGVGDGTILVRSKQPPSLVTSAVREVAASLDSSVPFAFDQAFTATLDRFLSMERLFAKVLGLLAVLALGLAAVGLYGLVAEGVAERVREFGIRRAMGAESVSILKLVVLGALRFAALGVALGLAGAGILTRLVQNRLFGVSALEPTVYVVSALGLALVVVVASLLPAWSATRVDPMQALRYE